MKYLGFHAFPFWLELLRYIFLVCLGANPCSDHAIPTRYCQWVMESLIRAVIDLYGVRGVCLTRIVVLSGVPLLREKRAAVPPSPDKYGDTMYN